jgi:signal transduction histidine kinase
MLDLEPTTKGAGLGLYIAKSIVELHGGSIAVQSKAGQGSSFTVTLPRWHANAIR